MTTTSPDSINLAVVIAEYNYPCLSLVESISRQCATCPAIASHDIIVIDDGSSQYLSENRVINHIPSCRFVERGTNCGRAATRNYGASLAEQSEWLLFLDCDGEVCAPDFIARFTLYIKEHPDTQVCCGRVATSARHRRTDNALRYYYERAADKARLRQSQGYNPYQSFTAFCVMMRRDVWSTIRFDETMSRYGYEDLLFGVELRARAIPIAHIDNPLVHAGIDSNAQFLAKTEQALQNLYHIRHRVAEVSALLVGVERLHRLHLAWLFRGWHACMGRLERRHLLSSKHPRLFIFTLYKIGHYLSIERKG